MTDNDSRRPHFVLVGASFSGNKGAAGMIQALMRQLSARHQGARFTVMSYFPTEDRRLVAAGDPAIIAATPAAVCLLFPLCLLAWVLRAVGLGPGPLRLHPAMRAVADADAMLDIFGISFNDSRLKFVPFNLLSVLPALAVGTPLVKVSQAMGPFRKPLNRRAARFVLRRCRLVCARGKQTAQWVRELGIESTDLFPDICLTLPVTESERRQVDSLLPAHGDRPLVGICPSQVVLGACTKQGIDFVEIMASFADSCIERGMDVLLLAHSARVGTEKTRNNDLPVCRCIHKGMQHGGKATFIDAELDAGVLRAMISECTALVSCRFHALVSALATEVPALTIGWSHKYEEALEGFGASEWALDYSTLSAERLRDTFDELMGQREDVHSAVAAALPAQRNAALAFYDRLAEVLTP